MTREPHGDEILMAYADGELAGDEARAVEAAIDADPKLAARVEMFRETARRLSGLSQAQEATVPDALIARVRALAAEGRADAPIDLSARRAAQVQPVAAPRRPVWQMPLAASILLALGLGGGLMLGQRGTEPGMGPLAVLGSADLDQALRGMRSGERQDLPGGGELSLIASFRDGDDQLCREFELDRPEQPTLVSVACHAGGDWSTQLAILAPAGDATGYAPASSLEALDAYLGAIAAGPPLSPEEEITALDGLN